MNLIIPHGFNGWGELAPIAVEAKAAEPFPVDALGARMRALVDASLRRADLGEGYAPMSFACAMTSIGALAAADFRIETLAGTAVPFSQFAVVKGLSGARKSAVFSPLWEGHKNADDDADERHSEMAERRRQWEAENKNPSPNTGPPKPYRFPPRRIVTDATAESTTTRLGNGAPFAALVSDEAGAMLRNWSGRSGAQMARTLSRYNELWSTGYAVITRQTADIKDVYIRDAAPTICWLTQPGNGDVNLLRESEYGFAARTFIAEADGEKTFGEGSQDEGAKVVLDEFARVIWNARERQDARALIREKPVFRTVGLSAAARSALIEMAKAWDEERNGAKDGATLYSTRLERSAELVARWAAVEAVWDEYAAGGWDGKSEVVTDVDAIARYGQIVLWANGELERIENAGYADDLSEAAQHLVGLITAEYAIAKTGGASKHIDKDGLIAVKTLAQGAKRGWRSAERKAKLVELLKSEGYIVEVKKGRWATHPQYAGGFDYYNKGEQGGE